MAPKSPAAGKTKGVSPKKSPPAKKAKTEDAEAEAPAAAVEAEEDELAQAGVEEEEGVEEGAEGGEAVAARTRAKESGAAPGSAVKKAAASAAANLLPQPTIADILLGDHRDTVALLKHFEEVAKKGDKLMMEKVTDALAMTVRLHSEAEFQVLYPLMEKRLGAKGKEASVHSIEEHNKIEEDLITALEQRKEGGEKLTSTVKEITELWMQHMKEEEDQYMPMLMAKLLDEEQVEIAQQFMAAKAKAPLQPSPRI